MTYIPISPKERDAMLETIGVKSLDDLFEAVPAKHRFPKLDLPPALTEMEALDELSGLAQANENVREDLVSFLGAGMYNHYIPSVVDHILRRGEFYTAYTPYQPEISQGTLQAIFEYQSLMAALTGMDVSNASHYDGATATAEAVNLAHAQFRGKRKKVVISPTVHPQYRAVIRTYTQGMDIELAGDDPNADLDSNPDELAALVDKDTSLADRPVPGLLRPRLRLHKVDRDCPRPGRPGLRGCQSHRAGDVQDTRLDGRGYRRRRWSAARHPDVVRRTQRRLLHDPQEHGPQDGRTPGRRNRG